MQKISNENFYIAEPDEIARLDKYWNEQITKLANKYELPEEKMMKFAVDFSDLRASETAVDFSDFRDDEVYGPAHQSQGWVFFFFFFGVVFFGLLMGAVISPRLN